MPSIEERLDAIESRLDAIDAVIHAIAVAKQTIKVGSHVTLSRYASCAEHFPEFVGKRPGLVTGINGPNFNVVFEYKKDKTALTLDRSDLVLV